MPAWTVCYGPCYHSSGNLDAMMAWWGHVAIASAAAVGIEAMTYALVVWLRRRCQWIVTPVDLVPRIDRRGLDSFLAHGWDAELGWVRKPGTSGEDRLPGGDVAPYRIGDDGSRANPGFEGRPAEILLYGDSYAFARQVRDDETFAHVVSSELGRNMANRGVGNYGLDQALLRFEREAAAETGARIVVMAVVPETVSRVLSYWKHFSEYGNTLAFKPRFKLVDGVLELVPNGMDTPSKFDDIAAEVPKAKREDYFYETKFRQDMLRFPYVLSLWRSRKRNVRLLKAAARDRIDDGQRAFTSVMRRNIALAADLYTRPEIIDLLGAITARFARSARSSGMEPVLVVIPQLLDLELIGAGRTHYAPFLARAARDVTVVDTGPALLAASKDASLYVSDNYGGHLNARGNRVIADLLTPILRDLYARAPLSALASETGNT